MQDYPSLYLLPLWYKVKCRWILSAWQAYLNKKTKAIRLLDVFKSLWQSWSNLA